MDHVPLIGALLARLDRVTHFLDRTNRSVCSMVGLWNFPTQMFVIRLGLVISLLQKVFGQQFINFSL